MEKYDFPINIEGEKLNYRLRGGVQCWTPKTSAGFQIQFPTTKYTTSNSHILQNVSINLHLESSPDESIEVYFSVKLLISS